jgi:hypothetical protein
MTLVKFLGGYNRNHLKTWDENFIYIQHSYHRAIHTSINKFSFKTCFGYFPPFPLDDVYGKQGGVREDITKEVLKSDKLAEKIRKIHLQVKETLKKSHEKYKT